MLSIAQLEVRLQDFDGTHLDLLLPWAQSLSLDDLTIDRLISLAEQSAPPVQIGATWVLKTLVTRKASFNSLQVTKLSELLCSCESWESRLQLLQMLPDLAIPRDCSQQLFQSLLSFVADKNKFIRAWGYTVLHTLASQHRDYVGEIIPFLEKGARDEAASVRARLRQLKPLR